MSFRPENEARNGANGRTPGRRFTAKRASAGGSARTGGRRRSATRPELVPLAAGLLLLLGLAIGAILLWRWYGDRAGGTDTFEDSVESGSEPTVRLTNGPGQVRVKGVAGLESVEVTAKRYARGSGPAAAKENAARVPVNVDNESSSVEISSDGGRETGVDYDLRVPPGSAVEVESAAGDVEVSGLDNDVTVRAGSGDVNMEEVQGSIMIEAPQGDVTLEDVGTQTGNAGISVGSGDVELKDLVVGIMEARVESGDVTFSGRFSGSGRVFVRTGSIDVRLPPEDTRDLDLEARVGEVVREDEQGSSSGGEE